LQNLSTKGCPCCGGMKFERLLDFGPVPVSGHFRAVPAEPLAMAPLGFELCAECGLVRQSENAAPRDYSTTDRATTGQFPSYGDGLISALRSQGVGQDDLVLDIGSNDGSFLEALRGAGFRRLVGVEPSRELAERGRLRGFPVENDYFGPALAPRILAKYGRARALVCRHTIEHVPDPLAFVSALHSCLHAGAGIALIEVPDGSAIPELLNVYEFWDEHLYCFCVENLVKLVERAGLRVLDAQVQPHLATRNLLLWCTTAPGKGAAGAQRDCVALWRGLERAWTASRTKLEAAVRSAPRPVYLIGGSHSQYNFANYAGIGTLVDNLIDDDATKVGRYPPVAGGQPSIISTAQFEAAARSGTVLKTGFGYPKWTARIEAHAAQHGMRMLDPHDFLECSK
jgi:SAM-dependent methyltransferase